jgi:hypothetical protein
MFNIFKKKEKIRNSGCNNCIYKGEEEKQTDYQDRADGILFVCRKHSKQEIKYHPLKGPYSFYSKIKYCEYMNKNCLCSYFYPIKTEN